MISLHFIEFDTYVTTHMDNEKACSILYIGSFLFRTFNQNQRRMQLWSGWKNDLNIEFRLDFFNIFGVIVWHRSTLYDYWQFKRNNQRCRKLLRKMEPKRDIMINLFRFHIERELNVHELMILLFQHLPCYRTEIPDCSFPLDLNDSSQENEYESLCLPLFFWYYSHHVR